MLIDNLINETDVREDVAMPMLTALGYARGTEADISREWSLRYEREFLGRKKASDPVLRGRADYVLSVLGAGRWVLEVKGPNEPIDLDSIEQSISYARHPAVAAHYAAVLNGRRFLLVLATQRADEPPLLDVEVVTPQGLADRLRGVLGPPALRRDCSPPRIDTDRPIAPHLRSSAKILGGTLLHKYCEIHSNMAIPDPALAQMEEQARRIQGIRVPITGGEVWRDETSRILARVDWDAPHEIMVAFGKSKGLMDQRYVCLNQDISTDASLPSTFDVIGQVEIAQGELLFNVSRWQSENAPIPGSMAYRGQLQGWLDANRFKGAFEAIYSFTTPYVPGLEIASILVGSFSITIDVR